MQRYLDTIQNPQGTPIPGVSITVRTLSDELVILYSDDGITQTANPRTSDAGGEYSFYAADGDYVLTIEVAGYSIQTKNIRIGVSGTALTNAQLRAEPVPVSLASIPSNTTLTPAAPSTSTVGTSSAQVLASNASRKGAVFINLSANSISFGLGATAVLNSGITLLPYGSWTMDAGSTVTSAINAIASVASSALGIQEFT